MMKCDDNRVNAKINETKKFIHHIFTNASEIVCPLPCRRVFELNTVQIFKAHTLKIAKRSR